LQDALKDLGAETSTQDAAMGEKFSELETIVGGAWEGIKKAVAEPILQYVSDHFKELVGTIETVAGQVRDAIGGMMPSITGMIPKLIEFGGSFITGIVTVFKEGLPLALQLGEVLLTLGQIVMSVLVPAFQLLAQVLELVKSLLEPILGLVTMISAMISGVADAIGGLAGGSGTTSYVDQNGNALAGAGGSGNGGAVNIGSVNVAPVDVDEASSRIAEKIAPALRDALSRHRADLDAAGTRARVKGAG
jgi:phage-related minor tail protein